MGKDGQEICIDLMFLLKRLDIGINRVIAHHCGRELYILLTDGPEELEKFRFNEREQWNAPWP